MDKPGFKRSEMRTFDEVLRLEAALTLAILGSNMPGRKALPDDEKERYAATRTAEAVAWILGANNGVGSIVTDAPAHVGVMIADATKFMDLEGVSGSGRPN